MLSNEGMIIAKAAERGVRGKSIAKALVQNSGNFGISQAMRSRGLATAQYQGKEAMADVNRQLKTQLNRSFSKVAISPIPDFAPPPPQMQNVGLTLMVGMANALGEGIQGNQGLMDKFNNSKLGRWDFGNNTASPAMGMTQGNFMPSQPAYVGVGANYNFNPY